MNNKNILKMKRFLISSPYFTGQAELVYNESGRLIKIDTASCSMSVEMMQAFKAKIAPHLSSFEQSFKETKATVVESEFEVSFEDFLREYPYKRNTHLAKEFWPKMSKTEQIQAWQAAIDYRKYCERNKWYNPKIAESWLRKQEYLNYWRLL